MASRDRRGDHRRRSQKLGASAGKVSEYQVNLLVTFVLEKPKPTKSAKK